MHQVSSYQEIISNNGNNFKTSEFEIQGSITKVDIRHFEEVNTFRAWHGFSTKISSSWREHGTGYHPKGLATDMILFHTWNKEPLGCMHLWNLATAWSFSGVGLYFDWEFTNKEGAKKSTPGLHVDSGKLNNRPLRWFCKEWPIDNVPTNHYYYQDLKTGLFYNSIRDEEYSLTEAINLFA